MGVLRNLFVLILAFNYVQGSTVQLFDDNEHQGFFFEFESSEPCRNLPHGDNQASSVNTDGGCVYLYDGKDCQGKKLKIAPGVHSHNDLTKHNFNDLTTSVGPCSANEAAKVIRPPQFGLYDNNWQEGLLIEYKDVCQCTNLPNYANDKVSSVNTHGHCVKLYSDKNCGGKMVELDVASGSHGDLQAIAFNDVTSSINVCGQTSSCLKLNAVLYKFEFKSNVRDLIRRAPRRQVEFASQNFFQNNGSATRNVEYTGTRSVKETVVVEKVESLAHFHTFRIELGVSAEINAGIPLLAEGKLTTDLRTAYEFQAQSTTTNRNEFSTEKTREFSFKEIIQIPPCSIYEANSYMEVIDDLKLHYDLYMKISGENRGRRMSAAEVRAQLPKGAEFVRNSSDFEVVAKSKGAVRANVGVKATYEGHGRKIAGCQE